MQRVLRLCLPLLVLVSACGREASLPEAAPSPSGVPAATPAPTPPEAPIRFAAVGDIGDGNDIQRRVGDRIAALHAERPIDLLLLLGDIIYPDGSAHRYEERFAEPWRAVLDASVPMAAALGNHDAQTRGGLDVMERFAMPGRYYSVRRGPVTFVALDTNRLDAEQISWLRSELAAADTPWRVLFMHHPAYSSGMHGSTPSVQRALDPIIREFGVSLTLAGHDHDYERTEPIGGAVHIVAGTACCLRRVGRSSFTAVSLSEPGVVIAEADEHRMLLGFVTADGRVADEITLEAPATVREPIAQGGNR